MTTPLPKPEDLSQSAAGEEDPGAAMDAVAATTTAARLCPECDGTGRRSGSTCPACDGTGKAGGSAGAA